jgi:peptidoglycan/LPS O-acetylase OafA/YrhL
MLTTSSLELRTARIPTLDGWRAIAILMVIVHHLGKAVFAMGAERYWAQDPTRFGTIGVPIFFGLSGLLITNLLLAERQSSGRISLRAFYIRRCFRILPPLLIYILAVCALGLMASPAEIWSSFLFFRNYIPGSVGGLYTAHLWSLSVEEHFYLLWPVTLCVFLRWPKVLACTAVLALAFGVWGVADFHLHILHQVAPMLDMPQRSDLRMAALLWGACAGIIYQSEVMRERARRILRLPVFWGILGLLAVSQVRTLPLASVWSAALIPAFILASATHPNWQLSRFLETKPLVGLGRISYGLYIWQQLFLVPYWDKHPLPVVQNLPWSLIAPPICALASFYLIEGRAIQAGRHLARKAARAGIQSDVTVASRLLSTTNPVSTELTTVSSLARQLAPDVVEKVT